ncbi:MAG: NAD-dependent epimerase/dehydratase family protein [candidate division Zixibacteria bacterium]|nr:NAD-dependent epimerase/dehydratase family protein [candidate division Zixibacteria bacterium]
MNVLVTGASGQLGRRLVPALIGRGYTVKGHYRSREKASRYATMGMETILGDLTEPSWLNDAVSGCDAVIHCAAKVSLRPENREEMQRVNVSGTEAVVEACRNEDVRRLIHVSSVVAVGASDNGRLIDEDARFNLGQLNLSYVDTKREAEEIALSANSRDLQVVVVNPSIMLSLPDEITESDYSKIPGWIPVYFDFGLNLVETDDVVEGIMSAMEKGAPGERYLLTGDNINPQAALELARKHTSIKGPYIKIPVAVLYPIAWVAETVRKLQGKRVKFHRGLVKLAKYRFIYSNRKARDQLDFDPKPLELTIEHLLRRMQRSLSR